MIALIISVVILLILYGMTAAIINGAKKQSAKAKLEHFIPKNSEVPIPPDVLMDVNFDYVVNHIRKNLNLGDIIEINIPSFIQQYPRKCPFKVHDLLYSVAKRLSLETTSKYLIRYDSQVTIKYFKKLNHGIFEQKENARILEPCFHWFLWRYDSNPYDLDPAFTKIDVSTNLLFGRMYGYHDYKASECSMDCWERYTPISEYLGGKTAGMTVLVERTTRPHVHVFPYEKTELEKSEILEIARNKEISEALKPRAQLVGNVFYESIATQLMTICFKNDPQMLRNRIAPFDVKSDWGNNFDAWFFACSVFLGSRMLSANVGDQKLLKDKSDFISSCYALRVDPLDLNIDRLAYEALGGIKFLARKQSIGFGDFFTRVEPYMENRFQEVFLDLVKRGATDENIDITTLFAFWNYLLFGSYETISMWNRSMANTAINFLMNALKDYSIKYGEKEGDGFLDPALN